MKLVDLDNLFIVCSLGCDWWAVIIDWDNGLAPDRHQANI